MSNFNLNLAISNCVDLHDQLKQKLEEYNQFVDKYNSEYNQLVTHLKDTNNTEALQQTSQVLVSGIKKIDIEQVTGPLPSDMEVITYNDLDNEPENITQTNQQKEVLNEYDTTDYTEDMTDDYNDYDDFSMGSGTRADKGSGKSNYKMVYNTKHIRKIAGRK